MHTVLSLKVSDDGTMYFVHGRHDQIVHGFPCTQFPEGEQLRELFNEEVDEMVREIYYPEYQNEGTE